MDRVFLAFERYVNFSIVALGNAACNWGRVSSIFEFSVEKVEMDLLTLIGMSLENKKNAHL